MESDELKNLLAKATPGPHQVSGVRMSQAPKLGSDARFLTVGPDEDAVALVFYDMNTGRGHHDAKLYSAAPDLAAEVLALRERETLLVDALKKITEIDFAGSCCGCGEDDGFNAIQYVARAALSETQGGGK